MKSHIVSVLALISLTPFLAFFPINEIENPTNNQNVYTTLMVVGHPNLDGHLTDQYWNTVEWESITDTANEDPDIKFDSRFKVAYNEEYLFVGVQCFDPQPDQVPLLPSPRDNSSNDWIEIDFDANLDRETAFSFSVSPYGVRTDMFISGDDADFDDSWHPKWQVETKVNEFGWTAELMIPFEALDQTFAETWGLQIVRKVSRVDHYSYWAKIPEGASGYVSHFGLLKGIEGVVQNFVEQPEYALNRIYSSTELLADFSLLKTVLEGLHPSLYRHSEKDLMDSIFEQIELHLSEPMTELEFYKTVAPIFFYLGDGHSFIELSDNYFQEVNQTKLKLPLGFLISDEKMFVARNFSLDETVVIGSQIISINGNTVESLLDEFLQMVTRDGNIRTGGIDYLSNNFQDFYTYLKGGNENYALELILPKESKITNVKLAGLLDDDFVKRARIESSNPYRTRFRNYHLLDDGTTGYLSLFGFGGGNRFRNFIDEAFEEIESEGVTDLIIDLRYNYGGTDRNGIHLLSYLTDRSFDYFDHFETNTNIDKKIVDRINCCISIEELDFLNQVSSKTDAGIQVLDNYELSGFDVLAGMQKPAENPFAGQVYVLINGGSFSVTSDFCAKLKDLSRAVFIGEETGGAFEGNTSGIMKSLILPNTNLNAQIAMIKYVNVVSSAISPPGRGIIPDFPISMTGSDIQTGTDKAFEFTLDLITSKK